MKVTAPNSVNKTLKYGITTATAAVAASCANNRKTTTKTNDGKRDFFSMWGKASSAEFQASQNISQTHGLKIGPNNNIYILSGSSGVGKDTILRTFLKKHPDFQLLVSHTTRNQRPGEIDGKDYYFINDEDFQFGIENGEFLEWTEFSGNKYGTKKNSINQLLKKTDNVILKLDTKGALKVKKMIPQAKLIFVAPPSPKELEARLRDRGTESEDAIQRRLSAMKTEMKNAQRFDYQIINDTVDNAVESLENILIPKTI